MKMKNRFNSLSLQGKIRLIYVFANLLVFIVNIILIQNGEDMKEAHPQMMRALSGKDMPDIQSIRIIFILFQEVKTKAISQKLTWSIKHPVQLSLIPNASFVIGKNILQSTARDILCITQGWLLCLGLSCTRFIRISLFNRIMWNVYISMMTK